jgi:hypothetical protein
MNRSPFALVLVTVALSTAGCSALSQLMPDSQLGEIGARAGDAVEASPPEARTSFPEAESLLGSASKGFLGPRKAHLIRSYFTADGWDVKPHLSRSAPVVLFTEEPAKGINQAAEGESAVCFEYPCALVQEWGPGWSAPMLDCNNVGVKVTCKSAKALP